MTKMVGNYLNEDEKQKLLANIGKQVEFYELIAAMKEHTEVDIKEESVKLEKGLKFDLAEGESVFSILSLELTFDENVKIQYIERVKNGNVDDKKDIFIGRITNAAVQGNTLNKIFNRLGGKIKVKEVPVDDEAVASAAAQDHEFLEGLALDENYVPGQLLDQVSEKAFPTDGCLPGGYIYCGGACGGHPACNSQKEGVNKLDTQCCKAHDCCWHYYPTKEGKQMCDDIICVCASQMTGTYLGAIAVAAYFC